MVGKYINFSLLFFSVDGQGGNLKGEIRIRTISLIMSLRLGICQRIEEVTLIIVVEEISIRSIR
ncbi:hypothetical protein SacN8_09935 [Sulfolobus acidocaldarius N8]|uniref:Uncharacterized protein n=2 Tax=Sulfolobus acidocaldarius TaxID=2285 RepID=M1IFN9_9CREN|nr:hypothetical protein SacN8_09935 [Sulfolobus acidocaldarius N8]AGE74213.1 hypothetical protein SacRon12I_09955 [Sulfolobus acidocaldarius Ron12/I]WCM35801.1 hypothetical protein GO597_10910 [Sulfolobus acidocaldarius DSM 639]